MQTSFRCIVLVHVLVGLHGTLAFNDINWRGFTTGVPPNSRDQLFCVCDHEGQVDEARACPEASGDPWIYTPPPGSGEDTEVVGPISLDVPYNTSTEVYPLSYHWFLIEPAHRHYNLRVQVKTTEDNVRLLARTVPLFGSSGDYPTVAVSSATHESHRNSNPWALDISLEENGSDTGTDGIKDHWVVGVYGNNREPQQKGMSEYVILINLEFTFSTFQDSLCPSNQLVNCFLYLIGDAEKVGDAIELTPAAPQKRGSLWYGQKLPLANGFETGFTFSINNSQTIPPPWDPNCELGFCGGGDGFAFCIQSYMKPEDSPSTPSECPYDEMSSLSCLLGRGGSGMAYEGIPHSLCIEFDTWNNPDLYDIKQGIVSRWVDAVQRVSYRDNHIAVMTHNDQANSASHVQQIGGTPSIPDISDGEDHAIRIKYFSNSLAVFIDDLRRPVLVVTVDLTEGILDADDGSAWLGFTAATSTVDHEDDSLDVCQKHEIKKWYYCSRIGCTP